MASHHDKESHIQRLNSLCRICADLSKKRGKGAKKTDVLCEKFKSVFHDYYGITIQPETSGTLYSNTVCGRCASRATQVRQRHGLSDLVRDAVQSQLELSNKIWTRYDPSISETDCSVCHTFLVASKPGAAQKRQKTSLQGKNMKAAARTIVAETVSTTEVSDEADRANDSVSCAGTSSQCDSSIAQLDELQASSTPLVTSLLRKHLIAAGTFMAETVSTTQVTEAGRANDSGESTSSQCHSSIAELPEPHASSTPHIKLPVKRKLLDHLQRGGHAKIAKKGNTLKRTVHKVQPISCQGAKIEDSSSKAGTHTGLDEVVSPASDQSVQSELNSKSFLMKAGSEHNGNQTSRPVNLRPLEQLQAPLTKEEEEYLTGLIRVKLGQSADQRTVQCKTKGQPIRLMKVIKPRKPSAVASSPTRRKRVTEMFKVRKETSGSADADIVKQTEKEVTYSSNLLKRKGGKVPERPKLSAKAATLCRASISLSNKKARLLNQRLRTIGVKVVSEEKTRQFRQEISPGDVKIHDRQVNTGTNKESKKEEIPVPTPADLPAFIRKLLDQYDEKGVLTWHSGTIPADELWWKVGADAGGSSFKAVLSPLNVEKPNAKENCYLILMAEAKDTSDNIRILLGPLKEQINKVAKMTWRNKKVKLFLTGDYEFLTKMYGLSGAAGKHPCLWCETTKDEMQQEPVWTMKRRQPRKRTLENLKERHEEFMEKGHGDKKKCAKQNMNVILPSVWDIPLDSVAPPYLHILLGVVRKHHDLLQKEVYKLDKRIACDLAKEKTLPHDHELSAHFREKCQEVRKNYRANKTNLWDGVKSFAKHEGPVARKVDRVLKKNKIIEQAYYSGAFVGNHCHKYLQPKVLSDICHAVEDETFALSDNRRTQRVSTTIRTKYLILNELYQRVHRLVSHTTPVDPSCGAGEIFEIAHAIKKYMTYYRANCYSVKAKVFVLPKQHILEQHCLPFIQRHGFALGLHSEQGLEAVHGQINKLKNRSQAMRNAHARLQFIMREQWLQSSPALLKTPEKAKTPKKH